MARQLLIATNNPGKRVEIQAVLAGAGLEGLELVLPAELGIDLSVVEDGETYAENASKKALAFCLEAKLLTLADDSGLEVAALDGAPGLHSARYSSTPEATDADRRALLLHNLIGRPRPWAAKFVCTVAVVEPAKLLDRPEVHLFTGECPGEIIPEERGQNGFGYDPIFFIPEMDRTMAELPMHSKNVISHRGRALQEAVPLLRRLAS